MNKGRSSMFRIHGLHDEVLCCPTATWWPSDGLPTAFPSLPLSFSLIALTKDYVRGLSSPLAALAGSIRPFHLSLSLSFSLIALVKDCKALEALAGHCRPFHLLPSPSHSLSSSLSLPRSILDRVLNQMPELYRWPTNANTIRASKI